MRGSTHNTFFFTYEETQRKLNYQTDISKTLEFACLVCPRNAFCMYKQSVYLNKMIMRRVCHLCINQSSQVHFIIAIKVVEFPFKQCIVLAGGFTECFH